VPKGSSCRPKASRLRFNNLEGRVITKLPVALSVTLLLLYTVFVTGQEKEERDLLHSFNLHILVLCSTGVGAYATGCNLIRRSLCTTHITHQQRRYTVQYCLSKNSHIPVLRLHWAINCRFRDYNLIEYINKNYDLQPQSLMTFSVFACKNLRRAWNGLFIRGICQCASS
jgi:hypothetical protein